MLQLITDRMQSDVDRISTILKTPRALRTPQQQEELDSAASKGSYNYTDLNRVTAAMEYLVEQLNKYGYSVDYQKIKIDHPAEGLLPDGYTQLEYIESTGQQYINTGFKPNQDTRVVMNIFCASPSVAAIYGSRTAVGKDAFIFWIVSSNSVRVDYGNSNKTIDFDFSNSFIIDQDKNVCTFGEESITLPDANFTGLYDLLILTVNTGGQRDHRLLVGKLYSCSIYDNDVLIRNYIPCKNAQDEVGLFDLISDQFYGNAGEGKFISGTEIVNESSDENKDPYLWYEEDIPTMEQMERYLLNAVNIYNALLSNPELPATMAQLNYTGANQIEKAMLLVEETIERVVKSMCRSNAFTFWSGNRPLPSAYSDLGRTWEELDAMNVPWENLETADWFLLAYGNLGVTK